MLIDEGKLFEYLRELEISDHEIDKALEAASVEPKALEEIRDEQKKALMHHTSWVDIGVIKAVLSIADIYITRAFAAGKAEGEREAFPTIDRALERIKREKGAGDE